VSVAVERPDQVMSVPIDRIDPCPIQPRVNVSVEHVEKLSASMRAGRHQPLLEVEPAPGKPGRYQIVCGEQRWRAAHTAGLSQVLARLHPPLGYLERLERQYEENHLRADLDPVEEAHCVLLDKTLRDIAVAERRLREALVPFEPLDDKRIADREGFGRHLDGLKQLLIKKKVHVMRSQRGMIVGPLSPWVATEKALGISEAARKAKLTILRLDASLLEQVRKLPAEHAIQIARLDDHQHQAGLVRRAAALTHRQVQAVVEHLRNHPEAGIEDAAVGGTEGSVSGELETDPLAFDVQVARLTDLCRQLVRMLANLHRLVSAEEKSHIRRVLADLSRALSDFEEAA